MTTRPFDRIGSLRRFATTTTIVSILGHLILGFEVSYATPLVALATAYSAALIMATLDARARGERPEFAGGFGKLVDFLLPYHIIGLTCGMFLYPGEHLGPIVFAAALAVATRYLVRVPTASGPRHFLNPSNAGILAALLVFPAVGVFLPYQFSSQVGLSADVALPLALAGLGTLLNGLFTKRLWLVVAWLGAFALQAVVRHLVTDASLLAMLAPATGAPAMLYTFFMITDPGTTPDRPKSQIAFGASIGILYGALTAAHVVYGLFAALAITCCIRGVAMLVAGRGAAGHEQTGGGNVRRIDRRAVDAERLPQAG